MSPEDVVQRQVDAYNNRDIDQFVACHSAAVQLYHFSDTSPFCKGAVKLKEIYGDVFDNSPNLHAKILSRTVLGNKVIDHEMVSGRKGVSETEIIAIYEVENDPIAKAHFIRK